MDVDNSEIDLISQFRTMSTNDKDYLIAEFKRLSNTQLSNEGCCFYLDLAEWNLNTALWAYYEYDTPLDTLQNAPQMKFLCDITIGEGESVAPNTKFVKTWRIKNIGNKRWPFGCQLKLVNTNLTSLASSLYESSIQVNALDPCEETDISVELKSPEQCGIYQSQYRLFTINNVPFGDPIWLVLNVEVGGVLGITQQLNSVNMFGNMSSNNQNNINLNNNSSFNHLNQCKTNALNLSSTNTNTTNYQLASNNNTTNIIKQNEAITTDSTTAYLKQHQQQQLETATAYFNNTLLDDETRPDFYDDMFS